MEIKRKMTVQSIFWQFLIWFCVLTGGIILICFLIFNTAVATRMVYPANYGETMLEANRDKIQSAGTVTEDMMPPDCYYGVYLNDGTFLYGSLKGQKRGKVWKEYAAGGSGNGKLGYLKFFPRDGETCIAVYQLKAAFTDPKLQKLLPGLPESLILLFLAAFGVESVLLIRRFGQKFRRELDAVKQVTEKVSQQDLEFERPDTQIYEIDKVMGSLMKMKEALEDSLKQQWRQEEVRRNEVRALVHDIKTPLTVIRGNTQLLGEAESAQESREYQEFILQETERIEQYIQTLHEMLKSERAVSFREEKVGLQEFTDTFISLARNLAATRGQRLEVEISFLSDYIMSDRQLLRRAWENLLYNAAEYTPDSGLLRIAIKESGGMLLFQIEDSGPGFTEEDIRCGTEQFYQGDKSRSLRSHHGMGLFIVKSFVGQQGGSLKLGNSETTKGACVRLEMRIGRSGRTEN